MVQEYPKSPERWLSELYVRTTVKGMPLTGIARSCSEKLNWPIFDGAFGLPAGFGAEILVGT
jgi:hypothetical protein